MPNATTSELSRRCRHCGAALDRASSFCSKCGVTADLPGKPVDELGASLQALFGRELEIQGELGRGGMAAVYAAFDPALQRRVAVKVLLPEQAEEPGMANRFLQEARTVASLQHPHVVTVYGVRANDSAQAIVMQFVEGRSLDTVLEGSSKLPLPVAALILSQAASGLQHAHDRGIIHRDVKPANVLLDHEGHAIVSDFGIARRDAAPRTTATGIVIGTWSYMSPEQRTAQSVTGATDQYALGVMAFEVLTGELPFKGTFMEVLAAHLTEPPPSLRERRPEVPPSIEALVHRMMAKSPADRFPSLREAERAFRALVPDEGATTQVIASYSHVKAAVGSAKFAASAAAVVAPSRSRALVGTAAGAVLLVLGALVWQKMQTRPPVSPRGAASTEQAKTAAPAEAQPGAARAGPADASSRAAAHGDAATSFTKAAPSSGGAAPPVLAPHVDSTPIRADSSPSRAPAVATPVAAAVATPAPDAAAPAASATIADARKIGRDFVTMLNQRRYRELAQLPAKGGDAASRAELIGLVQNARDFAAGFERIASAPDRTSDGFMTDFLLDLEWQGGRKLMLVTAIATMQGGSWRLAGFGVEAAH